jgi:magnesium chelatase family protein
MPARSTDLFGLALLNDPFFLFILFKPEAMSTLKAAMEERGPSARALDKVLCVARAIADLEGPDEIKPQHIAEAVGYRSLDRIVWM